MIDLKDLSENLELIREKTAARGADFDFEKITSLAAQRREAIFRFETLRAEQKKASDGMKSLKPGSEEFTALRAQLRQMSEDIAGLETTRRDIEAETDALLMTLPNPIGEHTPIGTDEDQNVEIRRAGTIRPMDFTPKDHVELGETLGILDHATAAKISGARFTFLKGAGARLHRALANFMLDVHTREHGYEEMYTPYLVLGDALRGTGQLPKFEEDLFKADEHYLIPTAEVPLTNYHRESIIEDLSEPIQLVAHTPCFRSEAGSHGRDTRGMIRQHQFDKVELVKICRPEQSEAEHMKLVDNATRILDLLELPYRVMELCSGDIGFSAQRCFDIEVWLPSQDRYREISSCSNCGDFQARRAKIRFRGDDGKNVYAHTLNGSGLAVGRTWLAILENYQQADGSVIVPEILRPYLGQDRLSVSGD